ncbi:MAG TPA: serine/threonine-protein kinase [Polyangiaceae bacterium]|nr:serine/threonine-protein kinase [Polyangiaceae bacterium]
MDPNRLQSSKYPDGTDGAESEVSSPNQSRARALGNHLPGSGAPGNGSPGSSIPGSSIPGSSVLESSVQNATLPSAGAGSGVLSEGIPSAGGFASGGLSSDAMFSAGLPVAAGLSSGGVPSGTMPSAMPVAGSLSGPVPITDPNQAARMYGMLAPGSNFGVYVVGNCIGEGGMARIYRAEHAGLRRHVALKVLTNGIAKDPDGRERFVREARIAAAIKHPNVVNIFDVGVHDDIPYLVMELLEGTDLESLIKTKGALDESTILDIIVPVVAGLTAVHDAGVVHRDLKPGNIFLSKGRYDEIEPKLLDFGISKAGEADKLRLTTHGLLVGTPFYMSPEGLRGEEMTPHSDQYSLGVLMYECATGRVPFTASTFPDLFRVISNGDYPALTETNSKVSKRLIRIIQRAMSLDPRQRFSDLRELGRELLLLSGQRTRITWGLSFGETRQHSQASRLSSMVPVAGSLQPKPAPARRKLAPWLMLGAAAFLLMGFAVVKHTAWDTVAATPPTSAELPHSLPGTESATQVTQTPPSEVPNGLVDRADPASGSLVQGGSQVPASAVKAALGEKSEATGTGVLSGPEVLPLSVTAELPVKRVLTRPSMQQVRAPSRNNADTTRNSAGVSNSGSSAKSAESMTTGSNGAPIFD